MLITQVVLFIVGAVLMIVIVGGNMVLAQLSLGDVAGACAAARDGALASGVELINSIALGNRSAAVASYYAANVIGVASSAVAAPDHHWSTKPFAEYCSV